MLLGNCCDDEIIPLGNCCDDEIMPLDNVKLVSAEPSPFKNDAVIGPVKSIEPVNSCSSDASSPNILLPDENAIDELTTVVFTLVAFIVPVTVRLPVKVSVVFFNLPPANEADVNVIDPLISEAS